MNEIELSNLQNALSTFLTNEDAHKLSPILIEVLRVGNITYEKAGELIEEDAEDILTLAYGWRLLLPLRASKAGDWEDRMFIPRPGEIYQMPNVIKFLTSEAIETGNWDPEKAIVEVFRNIEEPDLDKMVPLVEGIASETKGHRVIGTKIKKICGELGLVDRVDPLVSELKACGILSHKLGAITEAGRIGSPLYEINPSILVGGSNRKSKSKTS